MATGFASAYLCVLAVTVLFERPDGRTAGRPRPAVRSDGPRAGRPVQHRRALDRTPLGPSVAGCAGRPRQSPAGPFVVQSDLIWGLGFMNPADDRDRPVPARPDLGGAHGGPNHFGASAFAQRSLDESATVSVALAAVHAVAGLGMRSCTRTTLQPGGLGGRARAPVRGRADRRRRCAAAGDRHVVLPAARSGTPAPRSRTVH